MKTRTVTPIATAIMVAAFLSPAAFGQVNTMFPGYDNGQTGGRGTMTFGPVDTNAGTTNNGELGIQYFPGVAGAAANRGFWVSGRGAFGGGTASPGRARCITGKRGRQRRPPQVEGEVARVPRARGGVAPRPSAIRARRKML